MNFDLPRETTVDEDIGSTKQTPQAPGTAATPGEPNSLSYKTDAEQPPASSTPEAGPAVRKETGRVGIVLAVAAAIALAVAATVVAIKHRLNSVATDRAVAQQTYEARKMEESINSLRAEFPRDRAIAMSATHWRRDMGREKLISHLVAMEQWIGDVRKVREYEVRNRIQLPPDQVAERLEEEIQMPAIAKSAAELRTFLETKGPVVIKGRHIFM